MRERLVDRHALELRARAAAERPAGRGEHETGDRVRLAALEALEERRVLAVDRQQQATAPLPRPDRELAGGHQALLVRERERHSVLERPERRADAREADDGVEDDVGRAPLEERDGIAADLDVLDAVRGRERVEGRAARLQRAELELGMACDDLDRLTADRAGRTEQRDASHAESMPDESVQNVLPVCADYVSASSVT